MPFSQSEGNHSQKPSANLLSSLTELNQMCPHNAIADRVNEATVEWLRSVTHLELESAFPGV